ncbi:MAG: AEC family transporter [Lachnospiraceae bacterium]|nr:AEC family transporter [Lachnospiraceae bacterium]
MELVFSQIAIILIYVAVGFCAGKFHLIDASQRKFLSRLCSDLILPFTILSATAGELTGGDVKNLLLATLLAFGVFLGTTGLSLLAHKLLGTERTRSVAVTSLITYPNCTFLGLPLCLALFGEIAVLYSAVMIIAFNVLFFTLQYSLFLPGKASLKNLCTPATISTVLMLLMLAFGLHFPAPVQTAVSGIGSVISPLSLIIIGVMLSENSLLKIFSRKHSYLVTLIRNLLIPFVIVFLLKPLPFDTAAKMCILVYLGCPCATLTTIYAMQLDLEPELCVNSVLLSTLCFSFTLPLIILFGQFFLA